MKFLLLLILIFIISACSAQEVNDLTKYKKAYNFILSELGESDVSVSDTVVYIEYSNFWEELKWNYPNLEDMNLVNYLDSLDHARYFTGFYPEKVAAGFPNNENAGYVIFFSNSYDEFLMAELFQVEGEVSYRDYTQFNDSIIYLFVFDRSGRIVQVMKKKMTYN